MSTLNDWMTAKLGANWRTTLSGWASAILGLSTVASLIGNAKIAAAVLAVLTAVARILQGIVSADSAAVDTQPAPKSGFASPSLIAAMACIGFLLLTCTGCVTTVAKQGFTALQDVNDGLAASYGQTDTLAAGREALAEVEAQKTGRVLLPRGAKAIPGVYVDDLGNVLTNGVTLSQWYVVQQRIAERVTAPPSPAGTLPEPALPPKAPAAAPAGDLLEGPVTGTVTP